MNDTSDMEYAIGDRVLDVRTSKIGTIRELAGKDGLYTIAGAYTTWIQRARAVDLMKMPQLPLAGSSRLHPPRSPQS